MHILPLCLSPSESFTPYPAIVQSQHGLGRAWYAAFDWAGPPSSRTLGKKQDIIRTDHELLPQVVTSHTIMRHSLPVCTSCVLSISAFHWPAATTCPSAYLRPPSPQTGPQRQRRAASSAAARRRLLYRRRQAPANGPGIVNQG
ncbi:hypothetical protein CMUS01_11705 [Colletotrichum musicola]|uniref:Uncharacterized protein n=1 Tax=Colletotrichum musicola TaxID=2175873 RepID=A0A8H6JVG6_9PEZI|nr:hypothetical protein CMUS01_11705 [Colletotrichum musicola]